MSAVGNMKQQAGTASNSVTPITTIASVAALNIPDEGSIFYISGTTGVTSITPTTVMPGREITIASTGTVAFTGTAVATFPGTIGQFFIVGGAVTLSIGDTLTLRQLETGAWVQEAQSNNT